jgi:hypothetical protein
LDALPEKFGRFLQIAHRADSKADENNPPNNKMACLDADALMR